MKMRFFLPAVACLLALACESSPEKTVGEAAAESASETSEAAPRGIAILPYEGEWADYPPLGRAQEQLGDAVDTAADLVMRRLGVTPDPDRPRQIGIFDKVPAPAIRTKVVDGRTTQVLLVPAVPLARGTVPLDTMVTELVTRAALSDLAGEGIPSWYAVGAPYWLSGGWEGALYRRILGAPLVPEKIDDVVPAIRIQDQDNDPLSAALFLRYLAEEYGAEKVPALSRALLSAESVDGAFRAALGIAPESLPVAFDSYRSRVVGDILGSDFVRLVGAARRRAPADRIPALSGLALRAPSRYVAAAVLEDLAIAQFEAGMFADAALTFARVEREYGAYALSPDRDLLFFALTFARTDDPDGARLRLVSFLGEYPRSPYASLALIELAAILTETGETAEAIRRYEEIVSRYPDSPHAVSAHLILAATARSAYRFAACRRHLLAAGDAPGAQRALAELDGIEKEGLSPAATSAVRSAVRDLLGDDATRADAAATLLADIGPLVRPELMMPLRGKGQFRPAAGRMRALFVIGTWTRAGAWPDPLADFLHGDDPEVAARLFDILEELEVSETEIVAALELAPYAVAAAAGEFDRRFRARSDTDGLVRSESFKDRLIAAQRLGSEDRDDALLLLSRLIADPSPQVRRAATAALGRRTEKDARRVVERALKDPSRLVRIEAIVACGRLGDYEPARRRGLVDAEPTVRVAAGKVLFDSGDAANIALAVGLLADTSALVRTSMEQVLRSRATDDLGPALAAALGQASLPGHGVRIVRVMSHHTELDFGYDPYAGPDERRRVAEAFLSVWPPRKNQ